VALVWVKPSALTTGTLAHLHSSGMIGSKIELVPCADAAIGSTNEISRRKLRSGRRREAMCSPYYSEMKSSCRLVPSIRGIALAESGTRCKARSIASYEKDGKRKGYSYA
jgi:hypothetical protein